MTERWSKEWWLHPRKRPLGVVGTGVAVAVALVVSSFLVDALFGDLDEFHAGRTAIVAVGSGVVISLGMALRNRYRATRHS